MQGAEVCHYSTAIYKHVYINRIFSICLTVEGMRMVSPIRFHTLHQHLKHTGGIKRNEIKIIEVSNTSND